MGRKRGPEALSKERTKPWQNLGISRRTYYEQQRELGDARRLVDSLPGNFDPAAYVARSGLEAGELFYLFRWLEFHLSAGMQQLRHEGYRPAQTSLLGTIAAPEGNQEAPQRTVLAKATPAKEALQKFLKSPNPNWRTKIERLHPAVLDFMLAGYYDFDGCKAVTNYETHLRNCKMDVIASILHTKGDYGQMSELLRRNEAEVRQFVEMNADVREFWLAEKQKLLSRGESWLYQKAAEGDIESTRWLLNHAPEGMTLDRWRRPVTDDSGAAPLEALTEFLEGLRESELAAPPDPEDETEDAAQ